MARIPDDARCVFQGILFDVYQWEQELFDGSTTTFEAIKRLPSVQVIPTTPDGRIVLVREEQPYVGSFIASPGGRIERGDTPEDTVRRELMEELGMEAEELLLWREHHMRSTIEWSSFDYVARRCRQVASPRQEPGERIEPYLVTFEEFLVEVEKPTFRNKHMANVLFRLRHQTGGLEGFKELLFSGTPGGGA